MNHPVDRQIVRAGTRVDLGRHVMTDRPAFMRWYQDPEIAELLRHDLAPLTSSQARGYFDSIIMPSTQRGTCWAIVQHATGELVGSTALVDPKEHDDSALFRIVIGEKGVWGQGFGTEATALVLAEAFQRLDLRVVRLEVFAHNPRARRAYRNAGFEEVGQHREWVSRAARQIDVVEMRVTRSQWQERRKTG